MNYVSSGALTACNSPVTNHYFSRQQLEVCAYLDDGSRYRFNCYDISAQGISLHATYAEALAINPDGLMVSSESPRLVRILFSVPLESRCAIIDISCQVQYVAIQPDAIADEKFIVGLQFRMFGGNSREYLSRYLNVRF